MSDIRLYIDPRINLNITPATLGLIEKTVTFWRSSHPSERDPGMEQLGDFLRSALLNVRNHDEVLKGIRMASTTASVEPETSIGLCLEPLVEAATPPAAPVAPPPPTVPDAPIPEGVIDEPEAPAIPPCVAPPTGHPPTINFGPPAVEGPLPRPAYHDEPPPSDTGIQRPPPSGRPPPPVSGPPPGGPPPYGGSIPPGAPPLPPEAQF